MENRNQTTIPPEILSAVRRIEIRTRRLVDEVFSGEYHSVFRGRGVEFREVREYTPGDDVRTIDWNVTARNDAPFVKQFEEERELTVMLAADVSASGRFGSSDRTKAEVAAELCGVLAFAATSNKDKVGLLLFSDHVEKYIPPAKGRSHVLRIIRELLTYRPEGVGTDLKPPLETLGRVLKRKATIFLVSDFWAGDFSHSLRTVGRRHDCVAVRACATRAKPTCPMSAWWAGRTPRPGRPCSWTPARRLLATSCASGRPVTTVTSSVPSVRPGSTWWTWPPPRATWSRCTASSPRGWGGVDVGVAR